MTETNDKEAEKIFHGIFDRGTQWEIAEVENEHKAIEDIDRDCDWANYGNHQVIAAKIFNDLNLGWRVFKIDMYEGIERDYFDDSYDFDEFCLLIKKVKAKKEKPEKHS